MCVLQLVIHLLTLHRENNKKCVTYQYIEKKTFENILFIFSIKFSLKNRVSSIINFLLVMYIVNYEVIIKNRKKIWILKLKKNVIKYMH